MQTYSIKILQKEGGSILWPYYLEAPTRNCSRCFLAGRGRLSPRVATRNATNERGKSSSSSINQQPTNPAICCLLSGPHSSAFCAFHRARRAWDWLPNQIRLCNSTWPPCCRRRRRVASMAVRGFWHYQNNKMTNDTRVCGHQLATPLHSTPLGSTSRRQVGWPATLPTLFCIGHRRAAPLAASSSLFVAFTKKSKFTIK